MCIKSCSRGVCEHPARWPPRRLHWGEKMVPDKVVLSIELTFAVTPFKYSGGYQFSVRWSSPPSLSHIQYIYKHTASTLMHSISLALYTSLTGNSNPKPLFTSQHAFLMYICKERGPARIIRSKAPLKRIRGGGGGSCARCSLNLPTVSSHGAGD